MPNPSRFKRRRAVETAMDFIGGRTPIGVGALRTDDAVALARDAEAASADGLLLAPISYAPLTESQVLRPVLAVVGATDLPLWLDHSTMIASPSAKV